ncbi:SGNH/GDSL hydrolase family protein [Rhizomicrobium electricum]|uniref:SGNH/GDSL hydrolase family protein n=1 Tax=Rhizomicrobium electricum TaxID=480070 RepID=A0ABN1EVN2_9PROT|nr:SGNH/GDSL hydrolase family protein [Rhizomicrobium electricum]NIJ49497.1 lysophospholipase L1-like esterase [Rhizomicrobium electricum]
MRRAGWLAFAAVMWTAAAVAAPSWVTSWSTAQQIVEPNNMLAPADMTGATVRQVVRLSIGGSAYRLMLSNTFGTAPLHLKAVHIAKSLGGDAIDPATDRALTFDGKPDVTIPAGATWLSDPVTGPLAAFADVAISIQYDTAPAVETGHPGSRQTSYVLAGDHTAEAHLTGAKAVDHWYQIAAIEVLTAVPKASAVVALGDSITDGRGSTTNGNDRWTNILAGQLAANKKLPATAVLNAGQGGNCVLSQCLGPNAISRIGRDVLAPVGVKAVIVLEGINDLGRLTIDHPVPAEEHAALVTNLIAGYRQIAVRAHARGLKAYIGTILPYMGVAYYHPDAANEADRTAVNTWIRTQKEFDGVIDFDAALRDPARPDHLLPAYDSGDFLHPSAAGYRVMGALAAKVLGAKGKK